MVSRNSGLFVFFCVILTIGLFSCAVRKSGYEEQIQNAPPIQHIQDVQQKVAPLEIEEVSVTPVSFNPTSGETIEISYYLSKQAQVTVKVFDPDHWLVKEALSNQPQAEGQQSVQWDGKDLDGRIVPDQAYLFTIEAMDEAGNASVYDPTTLSGGEEIAIRDARWNKNAGAVSFSLPKSAWVLGRAGIRSGPLMKTLIDWEPRVAGKNVISWNGMDESKAADITSHQLFAIRITAMALPNNSIIALGNKSMSYRHYRETLLTSRLRKKRRSRLPGSGDVRVSMHHRFSRAKDRAPRFTISFPELKERTSEGLPIVGGKVTTKITVDPADLALVTGQRYEITFYFDYELTAEEEEGISPFHWIWDSTSLSDGEHLLTVNVATLSDQMGAASLRFIVKNP